ncbi:MAG: ornithine cyclodeaminase [Pseudomonadota bacterium]
MTPRIISADMGHAALDWRGVMEAIRAGHDLPKGNIGDTFLARGDDTVLSRAAFVDGLGVMVKTALIFPGTPLKGAVTLFSDADGSLEALIDFGLLTWWKTAADSLLAASLLAPPNVQNITILGAGTVARSMRDAYGAFFADATFTFWNRTGAAANALAAGDEKARAEPSLEAAVRAGDIVVGATMTKTPILQGDWLRPGQHLDLIGAYKADMREADDAALQRSRIFVDSFETTIGHIGEIEDPLSRGVISRADILADYTQLSAFKRAPDDITLFKNGGGAHLDLMVARHIMDRLA